MASQPGLRPPQFSEEVAWLPTWLQACDFEEFKVEDLDKDHVRFEQRIQEYQFLKVSDVEHPTQGGRCEIGQLFLSGTDSSALSFAQYAENVDRFHLHLSSYGNSENATPTTDVLQTESKCHLMMQPLENSELLDQDHVNLSLCHYSGAMDWSPEVELDRPVGKNELLNPEEVNFSEDFVDHVELCIAASETLVINDMIETHTSIKPTASAILEAAIQMKQARLEAWKSTSAGSVDFGGIDHLSDLNDVTMENAYEDVGIHLDGLEGIEFGLSQVKDTMDSIFDEKTFMSASVCVADSIGHNSMCGMKTVSECSSQLKDNLVSKCFTEDMKKIATRDNDKSDALDIKVGSTQNPRDCVLGDKNLLTEVQEQFQSRWIGGWRWRNEENCFTTAKHSIQLPFVNETSFFTESADVSPEENSSVQNHNSEIGIASKLTVTSENWSSIAKEGTLPSQDPVKSSSTTFFDPLCSVVPCSISQSICHVKVMNQDDKVLPRLLNVTNEHTEGNFPTASTSNNDLVQMEKTAINISDVLEPYHTVYRRFTSLRNYSTIFPGHTSFPGDDSKDKKSLMIDTNAKIFCKTSFADCTVSHEVEYPVVLKEKKCPVSHVASDGAHLLVKETNTLIPEKFEKAQTKTWLPKAGKTFDQCRPYSESWHLNIFRKSISNKEKKSLIFQHMEFMLTGFSPQKEEELEGLIRRRGGIVLPRIPSRNLKGKKNSRFRSQSLPIILCKKKVHSVKVWYGCAVNAYMLKADWLTDSIAVNCVLPMKKYMILKRNNRESHSLIYARGKYDACSLIFNNVGFMLHGNSRMFKNISIIIKHGGGQVFKTLQRMVQALEIGRISRGVIAFDNESCASRHLKQCALEKNVSMTSVHWIMRCLYAGQLISLEKRNSKRRPATFVHRLYDTAEQNREI